MGGTDGKLQGPDLAQGVAFDSLEEGKPLLGHVGDEAAVLVRVGREVHSIGANCTHYGGPLAEGLVVGHTIRCPWHHACFDLRSGATLGGPALNEVPCFEVRREGELVRLGGRVSSDSFTKREVRTDVGVAPDSVVIVGAGPAGAVCAETLRREGYAKSITLLGDEQPGPVDRPNLSKDYLAGNAPEEWMPLRDADFYAQQAIDFRAEDPVKSIDVAARTVTTARGTIGYGALVLATGAEPIRLSIEGASSPHVHLLRTLADSRAIIAAAKDKKRAVVIGASFIGLEAAASLRTRGLDVTIVGPENVPLARVLGEEVGRFVQTIHEGKGETFRLGRKPAKIGERSVTLDDGSEIEADLVVMGVGVRPRTALAEAVGLRVDRGIVVDALFRTSNENVYAIGDVARYPYDDGIVRIEHFSVAERHGRTAALAMLGRSPDVRDVPFFWSAHHDVTVSYVGHAESFDRVAIAGSLDARDATVGYFQGDRVRAVATINRDAASLAAEHAFETNDQNALRALLA